MCFQLNQLIGMWLEEALINNTCNYISNYSTDLIINFMKSPIAYRSVSDNNTKFTFKHAGIAKYTAMLQSCKVKQMELT